MARKRKKHQKVSGFIEELPSEGRYTFSFKDVSRAVDASEMALQSAIRRLKKKGHLVSPVREFFVIVPVEYRATGSPPPSWFIDDLMAFLGRPYYVGLLSAAAIHGAAHQPPQVFQVVTSLPTSSMTAGRGRIEYFRKRQIERVATVRVKTDTGAMTVSTPEATVFDLVRHAHAAGHLSNVATVLTELGEMIDPKKLAVSAELAAVPEVQRVGYLFQLVGQEALAASLTELLASRRTRLVLLRPDVEGKGKPIDKRWNLIINEDVEPDL
jgi:predicted transcriptional regulator of viral defense system